MCCVKRETASKLKIFDVAVAPDQRNEIDASTIGSASFKSFRAKKTGCTVHGETLLLPGGITEKLAEVNGARGIWEPFFQTEKWSPAPSDRTAIE